MKLSARNTLKGKVTHVEVGAVNVEVTLEIAPGQELVAIITKKSYENLGLEEGKEAYAVIKASNIIIGV